MSQEIPIHPAAMLFPMMFGEDLGNLADDIAANGLMEPIVIYHGKILDGRNRLAACEMAGVEPRFVEVNGDLPSATIYVVSKNLHRRHLTTSQRVAVAVDMVPLLHEEAQKRQGRRTDLIGDKAHITSLPNGTEVNGNANKIAADLMQVGERTVARGVKVKRDNPEAHERVKRGEITVNQASGEQATQNSAREAKREGVHKAYEPKTEHQKKLAENQKEMMIRALSTVTGICRGLLEMDVRKAVSACDEEERKLWIGRSKELASQLRTFAGKIEKGF